jgi:hypothetical protein
MKATVNIGFRSVELQYYVNKKDMYPFNHQEKCEKFNNFELSSKSLKSKKTFCKHTINFDDTDEWQSVLLFDGRTIDFHYDYVNRDEMDSKSEWSSFIFQGYEYVDGEPQLYDDNVVDKVIIKF